VACGAGTTNVAGDVASGANTRCDDACTAVIGVTCAEFEEGYLKASNTDSGDFFGSSVSLSGDTLAVGAHVEASAAMGVNGDQSSNAASASGAVYVFTRSAEVWIQQAYLKASNAAADDNFGRSLSLFGNTLVVGAYGEDSSATGVNGDQSSNAAVESGAVYVFTRSAGVWTQQAYLKASNTDSSDAFGISVSLSGDTLAVGAHVEASAAMGVNGDQSSNAASASGAVYVFTRSAGVWSQEAYLKASNTDSSDAFGISVSLSGDTLAVGAHGESSSATGVNGDQASDPTFYNGAAYVFTRSARVWRQEAHLKPSNTNDHEYFGSSVSLSDDTLAVSAPLGPDHYGTVYVFTRSVGVWTQQAYLKASNTDTEYFGSSVSLSGDVLAVGATGEGSAAVGLNGDQSSNTVGSAGAAYLFTRAAGVWTQEAYVKASNTEAVDRFGTSVSVSGNTLAVGAAGEDSAAVGINGDQSSNAARESGVVYVRRIGP